MTIPDPITALVQFLKNDTDTAAATGSRIFGSELPEGQVVSMPRACIVLRLSGGGLLTADSYIELNDPRVDILCYGQTPYLAQSVYQPMQSALKQMRRNVTGSALLHWAKASSGASALRDPDTEWPMVFSVWQVLISEKEVS